MGIDEEGTHERLQAQPQRRVSAICSRIAGMLVISRNPAFTYRNKTIDTKQSGRELGVRYVLEGACAGRAIESGSMLN